MREKFWDWITNSPTRMALFPVVTGLAAFCVSWIVLYSICVWAGWLTPIPGIPAIFGL